MRRSNTTLPGAAIRAAFGACIGPGGPKGSGHRGDGRQSPGAGSQSSDHRDSNRLRQRREDPVKDDLSPVASSTGQQCDWHYGQISTPLNAKSDWRSCIRFFRRLRLIGVLINQQTMTMLTYSCES